MRVVLAATLFLVACSSQHADPTVVTSDEDRQLDEAAASLEANGVSVDDRSQDNSQ
jgi:hypothetical protein